jgi:hypothetical protein
VSSKDIPIKNGKVIDTAVAWIKEHPQADAKTAIGPVRISPNDIETSFSHTRYPNKLSVLPELRNIMEKGGYIGESADWSRTGATDHYFAATLKIDEADKIVFVRVIKDSDGHGRFHVHEVFTEDEIEKSEAISPSDVKKPEMQVRGQTQKDGGKASDLYRGLIKDFLERKEKETARQNSAPARVLRLTPSPRPVSTPSVLRLTPPIRQNSAPGGEKPGVLTLYGSRENAVLNGRKFTSRFIEPGLISYRDCGEGVELLRKDTIGAALGSMIGNALIIDHEVVTPAHPPPHPKIAAFARSPRGLCTVCHLAGNGPPD